MALGDFTSECVNFTELAFFSSEEPFLTAKSSCEALGGNLAVPTDLEAFTRIQELLESVNLGDRTWLGVRDPTNPSSSQAGNRGRFLSVVDGTSLSFLTNANVGQFPWSDSNPSDSGNNEDCIEVFNKDRLNDRDCNAAINYICELDCEPETRISECFITDSFFEFFLENKNFEEAKQRCKDFGLELASIRTLEEFNFVRNEPNLALNEDFWIGLQREQVNNIEDGQDTSVYFFTDGFEDLSFIDSGNGNLPWVNNQPSNSANNEACGEWRRLNENLDFNDFICDFSQRFLCRGDCTQRPTTSPTVSPTINPTLSPTVSPTINPTLSPTINPTLNPIISPTVSPTLNPTDSPQPAPTQNPTNSPEINIEEEEVENSDEEELIPGVSNIILSAGVGGVAVCVLFSILIIIVFLAVKRKEKKNIEEDKLEELAFEDEKEEEDEESEKSEVDDENIPTITVNLEDEL